MNFVCRCVSECVVDLTGRFDWMLDFDWIVWCVSSGWLFYYNDGPINNIYHMGVSLFLSMILSEVGCSDLDWNDWIIDYFILLLVGFYSSYSFLSLLDLYNMSTRWVFIWMIPTYSSPLHPLLLALTHHSSPFVSMSHLLTTYLESQPLSILLPCPPSTTLVPLIRPISG